MLLSILTAHSSAVIVGTLPALKVLITTQHRASTNRSHGSSAATAKKNNSKAVPLDSLARDKSTHGSSVAPNDSEEQILVQHAVVRSAPDFNRKEAV